MGHAIPVTEFTTAIILLCIFVSILLSTTLLSYIFPTLITDAHDKTKYLDGLRGIAASLVVLNHVAYAVIYLNLPSQFFYFTKHELHQFVILGSLGVQFFFCITGMLFAEKVLFSKTIDWTDFFKKRIRRIVPAYVVVATASLFVAYYFTHAVGGLGSFKQILINLPAIYSFGLLPLPSFHGFTMIDLLGVNWTLAIEWRFYLVLPIIFLITRQYRVAFFSAVILFAVSDLYLNNSSPWACFVSGALCAGFMRMKFNRSTRFIASAVAICCIAFLMIHGSHYAVFGLARWYVTTILFAAIVISQPLLLCLRPIVAMGSISYSFYLVHFMTLLCTFTIYSRYIENITNLTLVQFTIVACFCMLLATSIATASYVLVERRFIRPQIKRENIESKPVQLPDTL